MNVNGLVMSQKTKTGVLTTYEYDALGRRTVNLEPRTGSTITHYNSQNQVDYVADPAGNRTTYAYDAQTGRKASETNALNKTTYYAYNNLGQVIRVWGAAEPVEYVYDAYGRLSELHTFRQGNNWQSPTWPEGQTGASDVTRWHYQESTGLLMSKEYPDGKTVSYTYEVGGRLKTRTWARTKNGNPLVTTYTYDPKTAELLNIDYSDNTPDVTFTYDRLGRQMTVTDYVGFRTFSYNPDAPQLEAETITGLINKTITRTYEEAGGGPEGNAGFNEAMTLDSETEGVPGRNTGFNLGPDYNVTYGYEANTGRFASVGWTAGTKTGSAIYSYFSNSDLVSQLAPSPQTLITYSYDPNRNLRTQVKNQYGTAVISQYDYQYDALGRRTKMDTTGTTPWGILNLQSGISNYVSNNLNQYTQIETPGSLPSALSLSYDFDGNLVQMSDGANGTKYVYDAENRLIIVEPQSPASGTTKIECAYDYMGRRVQKKVFSYSGSWILASDSFFVYDGWNLISESTVTGQQSPVVKSYVWGLDLSQTLQGAGGIGGLIAYIDTGTAKMYYYLYDANGNVGQLIDSTDGSLAAHYEYDPYGNLLTKTGSYADVNPYRFESKYFDQETGLGYWGYRYYSPSLGRWIIRDPSEEESGANLYVFVNNEPINSIDPFGLWTRVDNVPDIAYQRAKTGDDIAAKRTTWQLWEAECGDTINSLSAEVELEFQDWPRWLSFEKTAPGAHALPNLIQPGDIFKVLRYAAIIGRALPNASLVARSPGANYLAFSDVKGNYGFIWMEPKQSYLVRYEDVDGMIEIPRNLFKKYFISLQYGEVKTLYFPVPLAHHWYE